MRRNAKRLEMWKRLFAILIAGVMLFSNVSNAVFALEGSVGETVNTDETEGQDSEKTDQAETLTSDPEGEDPKTESPEDTEKPSVVEDTEEDPQEEAEVEEPAAEEAATAETGTIMVEVETEEEKVESKGTESESTFAETVRVSAVCGSDDQPVSDAYTDLVIPVEGESLDLTESLIKEDVTRAAVVEGTNRYYVESFDYDHATVDGHEVASLDRKDITEDTVILLHYKNKQSKVKYVYEDTEIKVTAEVNDPEAIPDDAKFVVNAITRDEHKQAYDAYMAALNEYAAGEPVYSGDNTMLYDIAFLSQKSDEEGNPVKGEYVEIQLDSDKVAVSFTFKKQQLNDLLNNQDAENLAVRHLPVNEEVLRDVDKTEDVLSELTSEQISVEEVSDVRTNAGNEKVDFSAAGFSVWAFTVDFHVDGVDYSIPGSTQILLSELIEKMQIKADDALLDVLQVEEVRFTNEELVKVEKVSGIITYQAADELRENVDVGEQDFLITSMKAFSTDEVMTIILKDGRKVEVNVTDDQDGYIVIIKLVNEDQTAPVSPGQNGVPWITDQCWIRSELYNEDDELAGYSIDGISVGESVNQTKISGFKLFKEDSTEESGAWISYSDAKAQGYYVRSVRLGHRPDNNVPTTYNEWSEQVASDDPGTLSEKDLDGWTFVSNRRDTNSPKTATTSTITIRQSSPSKYYVKLDCGNYPMEIPAGTDVYALVTIDYSNGTTGYGYTKLPTDTSGTTEYTLGIDNWYLKTGHQAFSKRNDPEISGHEQRMSVSLVAVPEGTAVNNPMALGIDNYTYPRPFFPINQGDSLQTHQVISYPSIPKDYDPSTETGPAQRTIERQDDGSIIFTDIVYLEKNTDRFNKYTLEKLLNATYNVVTLCDGPDGDTDFGENVGQGDAYFGIHQMGGILVRGDVQFTSKVTGFADDSRADSPSVVGGLLGDTPYHDGIFVNSRTNNTDNVPFYIGSVNSLAGNRINGRTYSQELGGKPYGINYCGSTVVNDDYVDWDRLQRSVRSASQALAAASEKTIVASPGSTVTIDVGANVTIDCADSADIFINIVGAGAESPSAPGTVINFLHTGNAKIPQTLVNDVQPDDTENGESSSVVFNYPNATGTVQSSQGSTIGHVVAPKALIKMVGGNYNGTLVGNNVYIGSNAEGHVRFYRGGDLIGAYGEFELSKSVDGKKPSPEQKYTFKLQQLRNELDNLEYEQLAEKKHSRDNNVIFLEDIQKSQNEEDKITFEDVSFYQSGKYYFVISESKTGLNTNEIADETKYLIECEVKNSVSGTTNKLYVDGSSFKYYKITDMNHLLNVTDLKNEDTEVVYGKKAEINPDAVQQLNGALNWSKDKLTTDITFTNKTIDKTKGIIELTKTIKGDITKEEAEGLLTFEVTFGEGNNKKWLKRIPRFI